MCRRWFAVLALGYAAVAADPPPASAPLRELHVPFAEMSRILAGSPNAVLLPRAQYEELRAAALARSRSSEALQSAVLGSADCKVELRERVASFTATLAISVLAEGVQAVPLRTDGIDLLAVTVAGKEAPLWREEGRLHVLVSGRGEHTVAVAGLLPVQADSARQILAFSLPEATTVRLRIEAPGNVELKSGAAVLRQQFVEAADRTELELVPSRERMEVVLSRNHRQRRTDAIVDVRSVQFAEVHEDGDTLRAQVSVHRPYGSLRSLRFALPAGLAVTAVEGADVAQWGTSDGSLEIQFRGDLGERSELSIAGLRTGGTLGEWQFPVVRPMDALAHAAVLGVLYADRLESRGLRARGLMPIRPERLGASGVPAGAGAARLVALYYAPRGEFSLADTIVRPSAAFRIGANHLLTVADTGLSLASSFVVSPEYERVFAVDVLLPAAWQVEGVSCRGNAVPFENAVADGGNRVRVRFPEGARLGEDTPFAMTARMMPSDWADDWPERKVPFPAVRVAGAREETGALAVVGADDFDVEASEIAGLAALDMQERTRYGLGDLGGGLAFRFEATDYGLDTVVRRRQPRVTGRTLSFFAVGQESLRCHYELTYSASKARVRELAFALPVWTPAALHVTGLGGTAVKEYSSTEKEGMRHWTVRLAAPALGTMAVGVDFQTGLPGGAEPELPLPVLGGVAYQSGRLAVEGEADLDVRVTVHPRPVDIGELASAVYRPGARLLGAYGFVGVAEPVRVSVARHMGYGLPPVLVERVGMTSVFGTSGRGQHAAEYRLRSKLRLLEVALPAGADLWSVLADGLPLTPLRGDGQLLFELPTASTGRTCLLHVVYETPVHRVGLRGSLEAVPPDLVLRDEGGKAVPVPAADLEWTVYLPMDYRLSGTGGTVAPTEVELVVPAAVRLGGLLYGATGGISFERGLIGLSLLPALQQAREKARYISKLSEEKQRALEEGMAAADKVAEEAPTMDMDTVSPAEPTAAAEPPPQVGWSSPVKPLKGSRSLEIVLSGGEAGHTFRSLGASPRLVVRVLDQRRLRGYCWAMAVAVFAGGAWLTLRPRRQKVLYVLAVLAVSGLLPALPGLVGLALLLNSAFYAAVLLVPYYVAARIARRCWAVVGRLVVLEARHACLLLLACAAISVRGQEGIRSMEIVKPEPMALPKDAMLVPCAPDGTPKADVLVPVAHFAALHALAAAKVEPVPASSHGVGGVAYAGVLDDGDRLALKGSMVIEVYGEEAVFVPLDLADAVVSSATLDGKPASLALAPEEVSMRQQAASPAPAVGVVVVGMGRHVLDLELRARVSREGGWQRVHARLPGSGASTVALASPRIGTEVVPTIAGVPRPLVTQTAEEKVRVPLGKGGALRVQWRPKTSEAVVDPTLTARSVVDLLILESQVRVSWEVELSFRRGERDLFTFSVPADHVVEQVAGENVRAWQVAAAGDNQTVTVTTLKPVAKGERFALLLRRDGVGGEAAERNVPLPMLRAEGAVRHTARLLVRHSPLLELRTLDAEAGARRQDVDEEELRGRSVADSPFGARCHAVYELAALPCSLSFAVSSLPQRPTVLVRSIVWVSRRERVVESRIDVGRLARPLHGLRVVMPPDLVVRDVRTSVRSEWHVAEGVLVLLLPEGAAERLVLTLEGRLPGDLGDVPLPRLFVEGIAEQRGEMVVQSDPGLDVEPLAAQGLDRAKVESCFSWLAKERRPLARLAYRHGAEPFAGTVRVSRRPAVVVADSVTNVRVADETVEEMALLTFRVSGGGVRDLRFALPAAQADAEIACPLLRRKTVEVADGLARIRLELQDEVVGEIKVLVRFDRARSGAEMVAVPPWIGTGTTQERVLEVENAGRDEVVVDRQASVGIEEWHGQTADWRGESAAPRTGARQAFRVRSAEQAPKLVLRVERRESVETAGARIGLAQTVLMVDGAGTFRGMQTFHVDNRTEQFLEVELPEGAALWTARVAEQLVKPVLMDAAAPRRVSIPLVKTAEGDLDYTVVLKYGGSMRLPSLGGKMLFPVIRPENVTPERSQLELRLPRERKWFGFDGTMGLVGSREQFQAGYLAYQNVQAKRLLQVLGSSNYFAKERARHNLAKLKGEVGTKGAEGRDQLWAKEEQEIQQTLAQGEKQIAALEDLRQSESNREAIQSSFANQQAQVAGQRTATAGNWTVLDLSDAPKAPAPRVVVTPPGGGVPTDEQAKSKGGLDLNWRDAQNRALIVQQKAPEPKPQSVRPQKPDQTVGQLGIPGSHPAHGMGPTVSRTWADGSMQSGAGGAAAEDAFDPFFSYAAVTPTPVGGLASLDVPFPEPDERRWETVHLATPRGDMTVTARALGRRFQLAAQRLAICLLAFAGVAFSCLLVALLRQVARRGMPGLPKRLFVTGLVSVIFGIFPVVGAFLIAVAAAVRMTQGARRHSLPAAMSPR